MSRMRMTITFMAMPASMIAVLFGAAGRFDLPFVWAYVVVYCGSMLLVGLFAMDPSLRKERVHPGAGGVDRNLRWLAMPLLLAHWVIAGLDVGRFHWSDAVPIPVRIAGLVGMALSMAMLGWAIAANPFFSPVVRIQEERGHRLVTAGPYRYVRHPGYSASLLASFCGPVALGSAYAALPILALVFLLLRRTAIEDRFLREQLPGYAEYAQRVRARWVPGVW